MTRKSYTWARGPTIVDTSEDARAINYTESPAGKAKNLIPWLNIEFFPNHIVIIISGIINPDFAMYFQLHPVSFAP